MARAVLFGHMSKEASARFRDFDTAVAEHLRQRVLPDGFWEKLGQRETMKQVEGITSVGFPGSGC